MEEFKNDNQFEENITKNENEQPNENENKDNSPYADVNPYENPNPYTSNFNPYTSDSDNYASDYGVNNQKKERKGLGIAGMVLGIVSMVLCCAWYIALPCSLIGLILSIVSQKSKGNGFAVAGIILCSFALAFALLIFLSVVSLFGTFFEEFMKAFESAWESASGDLYGSDSSSFDHNNGAIINLFNFIKGIFKR
ncbi:MAG: DUF4190 domain-containing protein [Clostridia bacterium]|nr:DUF4190 domain-containing protein [Clostridia bacterium]